MEAPHVLLVAMHKREEYRYTGQPSLTLNPDHTHAGRRIARIISFICIAILLKDRGGFMGCSLFSVSMLSMACLQAGEGGAYLIIAHVLSRG